jgi:hypothetical protein
MTMNFGVLAIAAKRAEQLISNNSPVLLTAAGVTGVLSTAYFAVKGAFQAKDIIDKENAFLENEREEHGQDNPKSLEFKDKVVLTWKCYIPTGLSAAMSITAIVAANRIGTKRATAMATAFSLSEKALVEYKDRVKEKFGERKEQAIRDEIIQERVNRTPLANKEVFVGPGDVLCFDARSLRYFASSMEKIRRAENQFNHEVIHNTYAPLSYFYELIGLEPTGESDEVGWNTDELLEVGTSSGLAENGNPYLAIVFNTRPGSRFDRTH